MKILSLFDGISCAYEAFIRAGIEVEEYYASEIDKYAITVSQKNHPNIIQLGSVVGLTPPSIDFLIGGSPCQDLSISKKGRKGLDGDRSKLFWEYLRILREAKPKYFILENVASMPKQDRDIITREMGVEPVMFNASLVSAQCRKRLFWTNISFELPIDKGILLKDILETGSVDDRMVKEGKSYCLTASYYKASVDNSIERKQRTMVKIGHIGNSDAQANRVYSPEGKSVCLSANGGGLGAKTGLYKIGRDIGRRLVDGVRKDNDKDVPITRRIELREDDKCGTITSVTKDNQVVNTETSEIRKLTCIECERLQGLPDNYTAGVSNTQRYKCLGNAFNVDVIAHILLRV